MELLKESLIRVVNVDFTLSKPTTLLFQEQKYGFFINF